MIFRPRNALVLACALLSACAGLPAQLKRELGAGRAVEAEVHGAFPELNLYVATFRNPENFFEFVEVSLVPQTDALRAELAELRRHDRVRFQGAIMDNRSQQTHVEITSLEVVRKYEASPPLPPYAYEASIPDDLLGRDNELFLVHAVNAGGAVLVVEHGDIVLPVYVTRPEVTRSLARNDVVRLFYAIRSRPDRPVHLELADVAQPIEVVNSITALHGTPAAIEGALVLFPQSPQVRFNVFAVLQELPGNLQRQFTLVNFEDPAAFGAIRTKLQDAWDAAGTGSFVSGRNKLISTTVRIRATGTFNQVDPNQANAQIVLDGPDSIEIL